MVAAVYVRKSTEQTGVADDQKSVTRQIEHAKAYAVRKGWTVDDAHVYVDDGISGAEFANRPGFLRLMNALKPRAPFRGLVMSEVSRLGREQIETAYALKQLSVAGVRAFSYLEDREVLLESATDKFLLGAVTFAADLEREKARQRTYDAMLRKAKAGHVTGGALFGYRNIDVTDVTGQRSHVERQIHETEAAVIRRIFDLSVAGHGVKAIAKILNGEGAASPRAQLGRPQSWAPTSVREVLFRDVYRGVIAWNRTRKRNQWGVQQQAARPAGDWLSIPAPALRIVDEPVWQAAHARLAAVRAFYLKATGGRAFGRPALGDPSKYLLTNLVSCGCCGGPMRVRSRSHGTGRKFFYGCSGYHERGRTVCTNKADVPMTDANDLVIEALLDDVLDQTLIADAVDEALRLLQRDDTPDRLARVEAQLATVHQERDRLVAAIAAGGPLDGLLLALQAREATRATLDAERQAMRAERRLEATDATRVHAELMTLAGSWRRVLADDAGHARPIVAALLTGRVTITPTSIAKQWTLSGEGTLAGLFQRTIFPSGWRPQRDSNPCFGLERATSWASGRWGPERETYRSYHAPLYGACRRRLTVPVGFGGPRGFSEGGRRTRRLISRPALGREPRSPSPHLPPGPRGPLRQAPDTSRRRCRTGSSTRSPHRRAHPSRSPRPQPTETSKR
jgi:site-specific DNA recombinase